MKNIGLIFETNFKIGGGHFWRCLNLAKVLRTKGRKVYLNLTPDLVNYASSIFIDVSTALNFVILRKKPTYFY